MEQSTKLADSNFEKLKRESERLEELTQTPCSWWIWIMIITVCIVFMWMIIFIRLFPRSDIVITLKQNSSNKQGYVQELQFDSNFQ